MKFVIGYWGNDDESGIAIVELKRYDDGRLSVFFENYTDVNISRLDMGDEAVAYLEGLGDSQILDLLKEIDVPYSGLAEALIYEGVDFFRDLNHSWDYTDEDGDEHSFEFYSCGQTNPYSLDGFIPDDHMAVAEIVKLWRSNHLKPMDLNDFQRLIARLESTLKTA